MAKVKNMRKNPDKPKPEFFHTNIKSSISETTILLVVSGKPTISLGCGVMIGPRMALTARHVIEAFVENHTGERPTRLEGKIQMNLQALHFVDKGSRVQQWRVRKMYFEPTLADSDLAILLLDPLIEDQFFTSGRGPIYSCFRPWLGRKFPHSDIIQWRL